MNEYQLGGKDYFFEISAYPSKRGLSVFVKDITERKRAEEELQQRAAQAALVYEVGQRVSGKLELDELLSEIVTAVRDAFDYYGAMIMLVDEKANCLTMQSIAGGYSDIFPRDLCHAIGEGMTGYAAASGQTQVSGDVSKDPHYVREAGEKTKSELAVPIKSRQKVIGVLDLQSDQFDAFDEIDVMAMETLADEIAVAIENARLYEAVQQELIERKRAEEEVRRHLERVEALREIDRAITSTLDLPRVLDIILEELERVIPYHSAGIFLFSNGTAKLTAGRGFPDLECALQVSFPVQEDALTREVLREKRPLILADAQADKRFLARGGTGYVRSWIGVPLIAKGEAIGFLTIDHRELGVYSEESAEIAEGFASQAALAIENARLFDQTKRRVAELTALRQVGMKLASSLDFPLVLNSITESVLQLTKADYVHIFTLDPETGEVTQRAASWPPEVKQAPLVWPRKKGLTAAVVEAKEPVIIERAADHPLYSAPEAREWGVESVAGFPLKGKWGLTGVLNVVFRQPHAFDEDELHLLALLADQAAIAIENARLYEEAQRGLAERKRAEEELRQSYVQLRRTLEGTVNVLVSAIEMRDPYTAGHQRRVTQLACAIANEMGLPDEQIEGLRMAGLIHDMGKLTVPAEILSKPGPLTDIEYGLIQNHAQIGHDILKEMDFPWPLAPIVLQHHERMDGSGYPEGLSGEEILLEARILAVADVVEAMASHRPYRPPRGLDKALEEISQNRGVLYDPEVVDVCLKLFAENGFEFE